MKKLPLLLLASALSAMLTPARAATVIFTDTFSSSTTNQISTPGGSPSASSTSYDIASGKDGRTCTIGPNLLRMKLGGGTTAGYIELQAIFAGTPVQLVNVGDSINLTFTFTNSAGTLLAGGAGSIIDVGLFNSGGNLPLAGSLVNGGLSSGTTYIAGNCQNWQGYVGQINYNGSLSSIYTRPLQTDFSVNAANNGVQDLLFSGAGTGLYKFPTGTTVGSTMTSPVTLTSGGTYTRSFTILLSGASQVTLTDELYSGPASSGTPLSSMVRTTSGGNTYTNFSNQFDGVAIGVGNKGTSMNPTMDISKIVITKDSYAAPAITGLTNLTAVAGNNATLSPSVAANPAPTYQWYLSTDSGVSSNAIAGATGASLTLTNVQSSQDGYQYTLVAANSVGTNSATMTLSVIVTPSISGLVNQAVFVGNTAAINATVGGVPTPTLQWQHDGVDLTDGLDANGSTISGSTSSSLSIANAQSLDTGTYSLIASNSAGIVTNSMYLLVSTTNVPPTLVGPNNITVIEGNNGTFSVSSYYGLPQPTLQWLDQTGAPITDATNMSLTLLNVSYSQNGYVYSCVASNSEGSVTNSATLTVIVPPAITSQPSSLTVTNTQSASFTVAATGVPAPTYQWYRNGSPISSASNNSATNATLVLASASPSDAGSTYYVRISNAAGTTNSDTVTLTVNSTMLATAFSPTNGAIGLCYDTALTVMFNSTISLGTAGTIKIYNVTNSATPVDTIDVALGVVQQRTFPGDNQSFSYQTIKTNGNSATIYPHFNVLSSNSTYYVTIDNGAFRDSAGANFVGLTDTNIWQFSTKMSGPVDTNNPVVNADGSADFLTVQGAVNSIPSGSTNSRVINIRNGDYNEIVDIAGKHNVTFRGQSRTGVKIGFANNATFQIANSGTTHARMSFKVNANDIVIDTLTLTNRTPQGGSQAEALMIESNAKRCVVNNSEIASRQDTILANANSSQAYFYNSRILGNFDYIWGGGNLFFENCEIRTISGASGYNVTAARTDTSATQSSSFPWANPGGTYTANGMSFVNCTFTADSGVGTITLAGSNGAAGNNVSWYGCTFSTNYIAPAILFSGNIVLWQSANTTNGVPVTFANVQTIGITNNDPRLLAATNLTTWFYGWTPPIAPTITSQPTNLTVTAGQTASFTVSATGSPSPTYQWLQDGTNAPYGTANNATLLIPNAQSADATTYSVIVGNGSGSVTSSIVSLTVIVPQSPVTDTSTIQKLGDGNIQFSFSGTQNASYRIWATADLTLTPITSTWNLVGSGTFSASPVSFTDLNSTNFPQRFYIITSP